MALMPAFLDAHPLERAPSPPTHSPCTPLSPGDGLDPHTFRDAHPVVLALYNLFQQLAAEEAVPSAARSVVDPMELRLALSSASDRTFGLGACIWERRPEGGSAMGGGATAHSVLPVQPRTAAAPSGQQSCAHYRRPAPHVCPAFLLRQAR